MFSVFLRWGESDGEGGVHSEMEKDEKRGGDDEV